MIPNLKLLIGVFLTVYFLSSCLLLANNNYKIVIISPRVGETIDKSEKEYYHLFQSINGFEQAIFFTDSSKTYYAYVNFINKNGIDADTVITYNESYLIRTSELIDNFEKVVAGGYQFTRTNYQFPTVDDSNNLLANVSASSMIYSGNETKTTKSNNSYKSVSINYDLLELSDKKINITLDYYPKFGFSLGVSTPLTTDDITNILTSIEDKYRIQGYSIKHNEFQNENIGLLWLGLKLRIIENLTVSLDAGTTVGDVQPEVTNVKIFATYAFNLFNLNWFKPYVGLGINNTQVFLDKSFSYYDRISPIDTSGQFDYLSVIRISGDGKSFGFNLNAGVELSSSSIGFNIYADYLLMNPIAIRSSSSSEQYELSFSGFTFGMSLSVYF